MELLLLHGYTGSCLGQCLHTHGHDHVCSVQESNQPVSSQFVWACPCQCPLPRESLAGVQTSWCYLWLPAGWRGVRGHSQKPRTCQFVLVRFGAVAQAIPGGCSGRRCDQCCCLNFRRWAVRCGDLDFRHWRGLPARCSSDGNGALHHFGDCDIGNTACCPRTPFSAGHVRRNGCHGHGIGGCRPQCYGVGRGCVRRTTRIEVLSTHWVAGRQSDGCIDSTGQSKGLGLANGGGND